MARSDGSYHLDALAATNNIVGHGAPTTGLVGLDARYVRSADDGISAAEGRSTRSDSPDIQLPQGKGIGNNWRFEQGDR